LKEISKILSQYIDSNTAIIIVIVPCLCLLISHIWRVVKEDKVIQIVQKNPNRFKLTIGKKGDIHMEKLDGEIIEPNPKKDKKKKD
jgi:hypothetical protein